ncbi:hypothetical protein ACKT8B_24595 (plasmid) [Escherichia coli]|uniref:hypothetical protein n=1 Tax=Escherichia coli TaxID=562 RepID=UPI003AB330DC
MDAHWKTVLKMSVKRWLWLIIVSVLMFATTGSLLWYQGMKDKNANSREILPGEQKKRVWRS